MPSKDVVVWRRRTHRGESAIFHFGNYSARAEKRLRIKFLKFLLHQLGIAKFLIINNKGVGGGGESACSRRKLTYSSAAGKNSLLIMYASGRAGAAPRGCFLLKKIAAY